MITMAQSTMNTHTHVGHTHSLTHVHQHSYNHVARSASSAITEFGISFILTVPHGANRSTQRKTLTACLQIGITY